MLFACFWWPSGAPRASNQMDSENGGSSCPQLGSYLGDDLVGQFPSHLAGHLGFGPNVQAILTVLGPFLGHLGDHLEGVCGHGQRGDAYQRPSPVTCMATYSSLCI